MSDILDKLADHARERVKTASEKMPLSDIKDKALSLPRGMFEFENALKKDGLSFICECKKASPSKGIIAENFPYLDKENHYYALKLRFVRKKVAPNKYICLIFSKIVHYLFFF